MDEWPEEVRNDLRAAVKAKQKEDWRMAASYFERAYDIAVTLPDQAASFGADSAIKISDIALSLADVLESAGDLPRAYSIYGTAFSHLINGLPSSSESKTAFEADQQRRAIGIALKMAELGEHILHERAPGRVPECANYGPADEAEVKEKIDWALTEALGLRSASVHLWETGKKQNDTLNLPGWVKKVNRISTVRRVEEYYSRKGEIEYSLPLKLYIISTLSPLPLPPSSCHFLSTPYMDVIVSFNVGTLNEMSNENVMAQAYYEHALEVSRAIGMDEGVKMAQYALNRLKSQS
ncbi:hypothetical protein FS837_006062 [Tulasnella sp. UAMH 9824]|nr:hypothetical protein FS837_006062 [Tulasnella sp. UAMH 9824]